MHNTKTYLKIIALLGILLASSWLSGCHEGFYYEGEYGWTVYEEYEVIEHHPVIYTDRLLFEIVWPDEFDTADLHIKLVTPLGGIVLDDNIEIDGCFFLGTYSDLDERKATIECLDPYFGVFDLVLKNPSIWNQDVFIRTRKEYVFGYEIQTEIYETDVTLFGHDKVVIPFTF